MSHVEAHGLHWDIMIAERRSLGCVGIALAWLFYVRSPSIPAALAADARAALHAVAQQVLSRRDFHVAVWSRRCVALAWLSSWFDRAVVDQIVDGVGMVPVVLSRVPVFVHNGLGVDVCAGDAGRRRGLCVVGVEGLFVMRQDRSSRGASSAAKWYESTRMIELLLLTMAIPAAAAVLLMVFRHSMTGRTPRWIALAATVATLLVSIGLAQRISQAAAAERGRRDGDSELGAFPIQPRFRVSYHWFTYPAGDAAASDAEGFAVRFSVRARRHQPGADRADDACSRCRAC